MNQELQDVFVRLNQLELENRRLKRGAKLLGGLAIGVCLLGAAAPMMCNVVSAERFVLRDEGGRQRMTFDAYNTGAPAVSFHDKSGKTLAKFGLDERGDAYLNLLNQDGQTRGSYRISADGAKCETKTDADGKLAKN